MDLSNVNVIVTLSQGNVLRTQEQQEYRKFGKEKKNIDRVLLILGNTRSMCFMSRMYARTPLFSIISLCRGLS